jgi:hypothetical protein
MPKTARIAAVLAFAFACVPAHALTMKDYEAKSDADKLRYLQTCIGTLVNEVAKTDRPLSLKIRSYYYDKAPGRQYPEGTYDLLGRIVGLEQQAAKDKTINLAYIEVEEVVARTTAAKFNIPAPPDFQRKSNPPVAPLPAAPAPAARPAAPVDDDPIGPGGFIKPPTPTTIQLCVPADLEPSWENPSADPEMEAFRLLIAHYGLDQGKAGDQYRIKSNAFDTFERARRAASPSTPIPNVLVDAVRAGQRCPDSDHLYDLHPKAPTPAPQK